jgi:hypothetical protein
MTSIRDSEKPFHQERWCCSTSAPRPCEADALGWMPRCIRRNRLQSP